ncbi:MAG: cell division protein FtsH, partial [Kineosporiaceae bacterium]|nr:cell division protein FtsH [Aeromicrobium sp.]
MFKGPWLWIVITVFAVIAVLQVTSSGGGYSEVKTATMVTYFDSNKIKEVTFVEGDQEIRATLNDGKKVRATWLGDQGYALVEKAQTSVADKQLKTFNVKIAKPSVLGTFIGTLLPFIIIIGVFLFLMSRMQGGGAGVMKFAKSKAKLITKDTPKTTFADVAGCDEAIEELGEIKEFLQEPAKFQAVGAKIPKGVLLYGP